MSVITSTAERRRLLEAGVGRPHSRRGLPGADADVRGRAVQRARHPFDHLPVLGRDVLDAVSARLSARGWPGRRRDRDAVEITSLQTRGHGDRLDNHGVQEMLRLALTAR